MSEMLVCWSKRRRPSLMTLLGFILQALTMIYYLRFYSDSSMDRIFIEDPPETTMKSSWRPFLRAKVNLSPHLHLIDLNGTSNKSNYQCETIKLPFRQLSIPFCFNVNGENGPSKEQLLGRIRSEEQPTTRLLRFIRQRSRLHLINIGTGTGASTLFISALGRFVLTVDADTTNLGRLRHSIQNSKLIDRVVLVHNAFDSKPGILYELFRSPMNRTHQFNQGFEHSELSLIKGGRVSTASNIVTTIRFDDLLPILKATEIQEFAININIDGIENIIFETGKSIFETLTIPVIQTEWLRTSVQRHRVRLIIQLFAQYDYQPVNDACQQLNWMAYRKWPKTVFWLKRNVNDFC